MALDVLLLDAQFRQSLLCLRTFARQGLDVGCAACRSEKSPIAFASRYASVKLRLPDVAEDPSAYVNGLLALLEEHPARVVLPAHDGSIDAIRRMREPLEARTKIALANNAALDVAINKERTLALARDLGIALPQGVTAKSEEDVRAAVRAIGFPVVIKPSESWAQGHQATGKRLYSTVARSLDEALPRAEKILSRGIPALVQTWLPGQREAVSLFYAEGRFLARFVQKSYREWPMLGGASVFYESIAPLTDVTDPAERLIRAMDLDGCSVVEFRRDRDGRPALMEVNPRMAGSVGLAVSCGVGFPDLARAHALGDPLWEVGGYPVGRRMRWLAGDIRNLQSTFDDQHHPDAVPMPRAVRTFVSDFLMRPGKIDPLDVNDLKPALVEMQNVVLNRFLHRMGGMFRPNETPPGGKDW